ncbi:hypothetical protein ABBQ38_014684 [Trebouxia sp. C0009 RCD-2024]
MPEGSSTHDKLSYAELAIEVQRLKILIGSCAQAHNATGSQEAALLDEPVEGTCTYEDGAVYTGDWRQDQRSGWGKHTFSNKDWYEGEWDADTMQGQGRLTLTDGSFYECSWQAGKPITGKWSSADGKTEYEGQFSGKLLWHGFGQWCEGMENGHGQCVTADGASYDGQWVRGTRCGQGKVSRGDGYQYSGQWLDDLPQGQGQCRLVDGSKYMGAWQAGKRHGQGRCIYASGDQYQGDWQADERHGHGGCMYACGDKYKGGWRCDKRHGQGVCLFADGTRFRGEWEEDAWLQSAADPTWSQVLGLTDGLAGQPTSFTIQAYDEAKNKRLSGGDDFQVKLVGPGGHETHASLEDQDDGTYTVTYCVTAAGIHDLHVTLGGEERVGESPYTVRVLPQHPVTRKCTVTGPGRSRATAGEPADFYIEGRDQYSNRCDGSLMQLLPVSIDLTCAPFTCAVSLVPTDDGRYRCTYTPDRPGFYRLEVTCKGSHACGSPFSLQVADRTCSQELGSSGNGHSTTLQHPNTAADICRPLRDSVKAWESIAATQYAFDGVLDGWDSDSEAPAESAEDKYLQAHPDVPVVDNLEDIWLVNKLQQERKAKERKLQQGAQAQQHHNA